MSKLKLLVLHCTATPQGMVVTADTVKKWHTSTPPVGRGWKQVGYSKLILLDGQVSNMVSYNEDDNVDPWEITNGVAGINSVSRHFCYVGGLDKLGKTPKDTRTPMQLAAMEALVKTEIKNHPSIKVAGHNQFAAKACPSFDVPQWLKSIGIADENIYHA